MTPSASPTADVMRVSATSPTADVAGAIANQVRRAGCAEMRAIGAGAVNQAIKGSAVAVLHLAAEGMTVAVVPSFIEVDVDGETRTAMHLRVIPYHVAAAVGATA